MRARSVFLAVLGALVLLTVAGATIFYLRPLWVNDHIIGYKLWRQGVRSRYVQVGGHRIHYFEAAAIHPPADHPNGIPILLIHGLGARAEVWSPLIPTLASQGFHVYVPDLLGFGRSDQPDVDYSMDLQEKTMLQFMDLLGVHRADLAGWSMGGWVALKLTLDHPELVDRLVVFDSAGTYFPPTFNASLFTPADSAALAGLAIRLSPQKRPPLPGFVVRAAIELLRKNGWVIQRSMASMERGRDLVDFRLHEIRQPTLIVWGAEDDLIPVSVGKQMHGQMPGSTLVLVQGCGHLAPSECAHPVLSSMLRFLTAQPPLPPREVSIDGTQP